MSKFSEGLSRDEVEAYLDRLAIPAESINAPGLSALSTLHRAHVTTVPFETLAITCDPYGERPGEGVVLSVPHLHEKIMARERGGYCFKLNGLFHSLLDALGYEVQRAAARMMSALRVPANHHTNIVTLDRRYVVDVGTGPPTIRTPVPLDGTPQTDAVGTGWRAVPASAWHDLLAQKFGLRHAAD
ncbi:MAG: arylamine N-acetyltransferase [Salinibacter sp.]|uniref:arylamine N-acetyltransferase n=1 Tax=Salinibacter sp. TaxID=2065818 RepID=UPI0035D40BBB